MSNKKPKLPKRQKTEQEKELGKIQLQRKSYDETGKQQHLVAITAHNEKWNIQPKEKATFEELVSMISIVLETGKSGTKAIREYSAVASKTDNWINEVAKPKVGKKSFKKALHIYKDHKVILSMNENKIYDERDILNNTVTGALTKLSKQMKVSKIIDDLKSEIAMLKENLATKVSGEIDWTAIQEQRDAGKSIRTLEKEFGVKKSTIANHTIAKQ